MGQDRAVSDNQTSTPKPNKIGHIDIIDDCLGRQPANCKTVYASSIPDVASTSSLGHSSDRLDNDQLELSPIFGDGRAVQAAAVLG